MRTSVGLVAGAAALALALAGCSASAGSGEHRGRFQVGTATYKNACNIMRLQDVEKTIGPYSAGAIAPQNEVYAVRTIPADRTFLGNSITSGCARGSFTHGAVTVMNVNLQLTEAFTVEDAKSRQRSMMSLVESDPVLGKTDDATVVHADANIVEAIGRHAGVVFDLTMDAGLTADLTSSTDTVPQWQDAAMDLVTLIGTRLGDDSVPAKAAPVQPVVLGSTRLPDPCTVFTAKLWKKVLAKDTAMAHKYRVPDPSHVNRVIGHPDASVTAASVCSRVSELAKAGDDTQAKAIVSIYPYASVAVAAEAFTPGGPLHKNAKPVAGYGDKAIGYDAPRGAGAIRDIEVLTGPFIVNVDYLPTHTSPPRNKGAEDPGLGVLVKGIVRGLT